MRDMYPSRKKYKHCLCQRYGFHPIARNLTYTRTDAAEEGAEALDVTRTIGPTLSNSPRQLLDVTKYIRTKCQQSTSLENR